MILSDRDIKKALASGQIRIDPAPPPENFSSSALDLRVGNQFLKWKQPPRASQITLDLSAIDIRNCADFAEPITPDQNGRIAVLPGCFILAQTLETVELPIEGKLAARVEGRSGPARLGLSVHSTAPTIHTGFRGIITLEIKNDGPFRLDIEPGKTCICQLIFERVSSGPNGPPESHFQGQKGPLGT